MKTIIIGVTAAIPVLLALPSHASDTKRELICGPLSGTAYYLKGGLITDTNAGWQTENTSGATTLITENGKIDVVSRDATGVTRQLSTSAKILHGTNGSKSSMNVIAVHPKGLVEVYLFDFANSQLIYTISRPHEKIAKAAVAVSNCVSGD